MRSSLTTSVVSLTVVVALLAVPCQGFSAVLPPLYQQRSRLLQATAPGGRPLAARRALSLATHLSGSLASEPRAAEAKPDERPFAGFSWTLQWYPLAFAKVTDKDAPHRLELFGEPLALWWDHQAQKWCAMADSCPHRAAPLSEGRIDEQGQLECPYHGWTFDEAGACTKIPQAAGGGDADMRSRCGGKSYWVEEKQGIVWIWGEVGSRQRPDSSAIPVCEALEDERFCWIGTYIHACMHACIHTYIHTYIHT